MSPSYSKKKPPGRGSLSRTEVFPCPFRPLRTNLKGFKANKFTIFQVHLEIIIQNAIFVIFIELNLNETSKVLTIH